MKLLRALIFTFAMVVAIPANAESVTFNLLGNNGVFDQNESTFTFTDASGLVAEFSASVAGSTGVFNANDSNFGINAAGGSDVASRLDGGGGDESFTISFSGPVSATLTEVSIGNLGPDDSGTLFIGGNSVASQIASGLSTVIPTHSELVGNTLTIAHVAGNGFSINSLTFHVKPLAVPEPSSALMFGVALFGLCPRHRRRRRN